MSPKEFLLSLLSFIDKNDKKAYSYFNATQLKDHIFHSILTNQIRFQFIIDKGISISGVCTFELRPITREIYVVGLVGNKMFIRYMRHQWRTYYPIYSVTYYRQNNKINRNLVATFNN